MDLCSAMRLVAINKVMFLDIIVNDSEVFIFHFARQVFSPLRDGLILYFLLHAGVQVVHHWIVIIVVYDFTLFLLLIQCF